MGKKCIRLTEDEVILRIKEIRPEIKLVSGTFTGVDNKAYFIHPVYGIFLRKVYPIFKNRELNHPKENKKYISRISNNLESVIYKIYTVNPKLIIDLSTYQGTNKTCRFFEDGIKEPFYTKPNNIIQRNVIGHPSSTLIRRQNTCIERYSCKNVSSNIQIKKLKEITSFMNYGVSNPAQDKNIAKKRASSGKNSTVLFHWKTGESLICTASYEKKVVKYLNKNKIDFHWQPLAFKLRDGRVYHVDMYLPDRNVYVEIKGYFREYSKIKWLEFLETYPTAELWDKKKLKKMEIL